MNGPDLSFLSYADYFCRAKVAWHNQDAELWVRYATGMMHRWRDSTRMDVIQTMQQSAPSDSFLTDWMRQDKYAHRTTQFLWHVCAFIHGGEQQGETMVQIYRLLQESVGVEAGRDLVMGVLRCFRDHPLYTLSVSVGIQKLLELDGIFEDDGSDAQKDQDIIKTVLIGAHHRTVLGNPNAPKAPVTIVLDWIFQRFPLRCDQRSHNWVVGIVNSHLSGAIAYLVEQTRDSELQLWTAYFQMEHSILASTSYCRELAPVRIFGVYLYLFQCRYQFRSPSDSYPASFWISDKRWEGRDDSELAPVDYGPGLEHQAMVPCPLLIRKIVEANRSVAKSARSAVAPS